MMNIGRSYKEFFTEIKDRIRHTQLSTILRANGQLLFLYWQIGRSIINNQEQEGWGAKIIERLAADLRDEFPDLKGFSVRNLKYMRKFAVTYPVEYISKIENQKHISDYSIVQEPLAQIEELFMHTPLAQISWYHHITLLEKVKATEERYWYIKQTIENAWSRNILLAQVESGLYTRQVKKKKITNYSLTLPPVDSDFAINILKDPYIFDFLNITGKAKEKNIEDQLILHITKFLLELGSGFAFIGRQYHLEIGGQDYYIDLLFYHITLRCYVVLELKATDFIPEFVGKLNFYISAVNDLLKTQSDNKTIGILLCKGKNDVIAEYALSGFTSPIGVAEYQLVKSLPEALKSELPSIEEIENSINEFV